MAYNSSYTGPEIDSAIGAVKNKEKTWDSKQDKLNGTEDQLVGFNSAGDAVAVAAPDPLPTGGEEGQVLTKMASGAQWDDIPSDLPSGGTDGQILTKTADGVAWEDAPEAGVTSFKGRTGAVTPQEGDYTADMVGARPDTWTPSAADVGAASPPTSTTVTLTTSGWSSNTQTITVSGVSADESAQLIMPVPALASQTAYYEAGILVTGQAANSLTFTCQNVPTEDLTVYVVMQEVGA